LSDSPPRTPAPARPGSAAPGSPTSASGVYAADNGVQPASDRPRSIAPDFPAELAKELPAAAELGEIAAVRCAQTCEASATDPDRAATSSRAAAAVDGLEPEPEALEEDDADAALLDDGDDDGLNDADDAPLGDEELSLCAEAEDGVEEQELALDENAAESRRRIELQVGNKQEKLRNLNAAQQIKLARSGELAERIALERLYGKQVWEALLHNPRLSLPEVARIARKGTVPKPLLDVILENNAWLKAPAVRRALLSNPKIGADAILKLLRLTPKHELKILEKSTAYGPAVREAARKLLKQ
jgi:hypothetical protein